MKRLVLVAARTCGLAAASVALLLLGCQSRLIYFPRPYSPQDDEYFALVGGVVLEFETSEGIQRARYLPGSAPEAPIWIWCPGNASLALDYLPSARGWDGEAAWLFVDYPGYGGNAGRPSPSTITQNVIGAVVALAKYLGTTTQDLHPRLGASGQSLGAAAALIAMDSLHLDRGVLVAPFTSLTDMGRKLVGWPLCELNRHRYDNRRRLQNVTARGGRVWIVHGHEDEVIPVAMARELTTLAPGSIQLTLVPEAHHNDLWEVAPDVLTRVFHEARAR